MSESGFPGFEALSWSGLSVHRATPKPIADKLEAAMVQAMQGDTIKTRLTSQGFVVPPLGAQPYTAFVKSELDRWRKVIEEQWEFSKAATTGGARKGARAGKGAGRRGSR